MLLVTGAAGFVGSHATRALLETGRDVRGLVRRPAQTARLEERGVEVHLGDVTDPGSLAGAFRDVDAVLHLAAVIRPVSRYEAVNVRGTRNVVDAAVTRDVDRFVHVSVLGADPDADHPYLRSRGRAEEIVRSSGLEHAVVRSSLVFGPGDHVVSMIAEMAEGPVTPIPGSGETRLQPIHVDDLARCLSAVVEDRSVDGTVEVGGPDELSYAELVEAVKRRVHPGSRIQRVPLFLAKLGAWGMQRLGMETSPAEVDLLAQGDNVPQPNAAPDLVDGDLTALEAGLDALDLGAG